MDEISMYIYERNWALYRQTQLRLPLLADSNQKTKRWSDQNKSPSNQLHNCETKKWKGNRLSKIGNAEVVRVAILTFVCHFSYIDIFVCIA